MWHQSLTGDLQLVRGFSASRSNIERYPSSQGHHCHTASWLAWKLKKRLIQAVIYGIKWLGWSQITFVGEGKHESLVSALFLCSLIKWVLEGPPAIHVLIAWLVSQIPSPFASVLTMSPSSCGGVQRNGWNKWRSWPGYVQAYTTEWRRSRNQFSALRPGGNGHRMPTWLRVLF